MSLPSKPLARPQPRQLLARILDEPQLVAIVQELDAAILGKLINHIGLENAGEIVALATTEQLTRVFDEDLWRMKRPGMAESFDAERFGMWLEIMLEMGASYAAKRLTEMDEDFVTFALARRVIVLDVDELAPQMSDRGGGGWPDDEDLVDKALESSLCHQFGEYLVIARHDAGWDAILTVLASLDSDDYDFLARMLERLCYISTETIEDNGGLYNVLTGVESLESDVAHEREKRREQEGFVPPQAAASFLELACISSLEEMIAMSERDPVTKAHFRAYTPRVLGAANEQAGMKDAAQFMELLRNAGMLEESRQRFLLENNDAPGKQELLLRDGLRQLAARDPEASHARMQELNYLANILVAGRASGDRSMRLFEAASMVLAICDLGLAYMLDHARDEVCTARVERAGALLLEHDLVKMFRIGWHIRQHAA